MNEHDLEILARKLPLSKSTRERNKIGGQGPRPCDCVQKYQTPHPEGTHHGSQKAGLDEPNHGQFRVTIILACSDKRQRDLDGAAATLLDCIVDASKRFAAMDS